MNTVQLGEHAKLIRGVTFKPADKCDPEDEGAVVCMRTKNVQAALDESDLIAIPSSLVRNPEKMISTGDILVSSANSWNLVGKCCQVRELQYPSAAGGFISILRPTTERLDSSYLYRWFSSGEVQRRVRSFGNQTTNISNLDHKRTLKLQISLPPLDEQKRIAEILDAADALRAKRRESLAQLDTLLQSTFLDMFGDSVTNPKGCEVRQLADVVKAGTIVTYGIVQAGEEYPEGVPYIRTGDLVDGEIQLDGLRHTDPEIAARFERSRVRSGEIVMSIRATVGTTARVPDELDGANLTQGTARISPGEDTEPSFLLHFIRTLGSQDWLQRQVKGATFREITLKRLRQMPILVPPLDLQKQFAAIVESVEQQKARQRAHLGELDTLFASLQSRAFRGDL